MSKIIEKLVISTVEPENKYVGWLKEDSEGNVSGLYIYNFTHHMWLPVGGGSDAQIVEILNTPV